MYCPHCGKKILSQGKFCPFCGKELSGITQTEIDGDSKVQEKTHKTEILNRSRIKAKRSKTTSNAKLLCFLYIGLNIATLCIALVTIYAYLNKLALYGPKEIIGAIIMLAVISALIVGCREELVLKRIKETSRIDLLHNVDYIRGYNAATIIKYTGKGLGILSLLILIAHVLGEYGRSGSISWMLLYNTENIFLTETVGLFIEAIGDLGLTIFEKRKKSLKSGSTLKYKLIGAVIGTFVVIFLLAMASSLLENTGSNKYIEMVKSGSPVEYADHTFSEFDGYFGSPKWSYFKSDEGKDIVEFTGTCMYLNEKVKALLQFEVNAETGNFEPVYLSFNDVPQTKLIILGLYSSIFENQEAELSDSQSGNEVKEAEFSDNQQTPESIDEMHEHSSYNWKYISDTVEGEVFRTHIKSYTHYIDDFGDLVIAVQSQIENISGKEVYLWTENYYKLTNNGIIKTATCDNWGDLLAPGAVLNLELEFRYDPSTMVDLTGMVLDVEGNEVHLAGRPQSTEELVKFEGYYTDPDTRDIMIVENRGDSTYNLIHIVYLYYPSNRTYDLFAYYEYSNFAPDINGYFTLDNIQYYWNEYDHTIQQVNDPPYILSKTN